MSDPARKAVLLPACILAALAGSQTVQAATMTDQLLASQCAQCHGTYGRAVAGMDSLAGESTNEIVGELNEMRSEGTPNEIMEHQALGYTPAQIQRIGSYYATVGRSTTSSTTSTTSGTSSTSATSGSTTTTSSGSWGTKPRRSSRDD
jgi:sulfide dehydrogenase cytochrome subunit